MSGTSPGGFLNHARETAGLAADIGSALKQYHAAGRNGTQGGCRDWTEIDSLIGRLRQISGDADGVSLPGSEGVASAIRGVHLLCEQVERLRAANPADDAVNELWPELNSASLSLTEAIRNFEAIQAAYGQAQANADRIARAKEAAAKREWEDMCRRDRLDVAWSDIYVTMPSDGRIDYLRWGRNLTAFCDVVKREGVVGEFLRATSLNEHEQQALQLIKLGLVDGEPAVASRLAQLSGTEDRNWMRVFNSMELFYRVLYPDRDKLPEPSKRDCGDGEVSQQPTAPVVGPQPAVLTPFSGGTMVFYSDRVELCGVVICGGRRSRTKRKALDSLRQKRGDGIYVSYSAEELAEILELEGGPNSASGVIRDLRDRIRQELRGGANVDCGRLEVILSGDEGYRLSSRLSVQDGQPGQESSPEDRRSTLAGGDVPNVPNRDVPNAVAPNFPADPQPEDPGSSARQAWIVVELEKGRTLRAPDIAKELNVTARTVKRDLKALRLQGKVRFVGNRRTGHYELTRGNSAA